MTLRELLAELQRFALEYPNHESFDRQVVVRVTDDEDLHVGGLRSATIDPGCTEEFSLVLDADQSSEEGS